MFSQSLESMISILFLFFRDGKDKGLREKNKREYLILDICQIPEINLTIKLILGIMIPGINRNNKKIMIDK